MKPDFKKNDIITKIYAHYTSMKIARTSLRVYIVTEGPDVNGIWEAIRSEEAMEWAYDMNFFVDFTACIFRHGEDFTDARPSL